MKNKIAAGILALVVGVLGVHRFYLGETGKGIAYLLFFWFPLTWLIAFIDGIVFLSMDDDEFNYRYNPEFFRQARYGSHQPTSKFSPPERPQPKPTYKKTPPPLVKKNNPFKDEGTKLYRDYDFRGAIEAYQKSLKIQFNDAQIHFNLACLYSLQEDPQAAFFHLGKAVEQGYMYFDKIRTHDHLAYLRTQPEFEDFVKNGYAFAPNRLEAKKPDVMELTEDVIAKLEKLAELRQRGVLTEDEFLIQKAKIMENRR